MSSISRAPRAVGRAGLPSTIIGIQDENWEVLREGAIPINEIKAVLQ